MAAETQQAAIPIINIAAPRASLTGVLRVNANNLEPEGFGLIPDEELQLSKAPSVKVGALCFPESTPVADAIEVFQCNRGVPGLCSERNDLLAYDVISVAGESCFSSGQQFDHSTDTASRMLCLFPLEIGANEGVTTMHMLGVSATEELLFLAVGDYGKAVDSSVNPNNSIVGKVNCLDILRERDSQVDLMFSHEKTSITELPVRQILGKPGFSAKSNALDTSVHSADA